MIKIMKNREKSQGMMWSVTTGHIKSVHLKLKNKQHESGASSSSKSTSIAENMYDVYTVVASNDHFNGEWILDSGCTYHVCPHRDWFTTYQ